MGLKELEQLEKWYFADTRLPVRGRHWNSSPLMVYELAERLFVHGNHLMKVADLGSGHGFVQNGLQTMGWKTYGIESDEAPIAYACDKAKEMGLASPQIIHASYNRSDLFDMQFPDGTCLKDIDFFFHYSYHSSGAQHMLVNVLSGPGRAKEGSMAWITSLLHARTQWAGFEVMPHSFFTDPCIRKVSSPSVSVKVVDVPSKYMGMVRRTLVYST
jgi:hypothetical protein